MIRNVDVKDASQICQIYNEYIKETTITFEEEFVTESNMEKRIYEVTKSLPWIVYEVDNQIIGYAYASKWKGRCAYRFSVESTVYLEKSSIGEGIGSKLYSNLINEIKNRNYHMIISGISLPNEKSVKIHEKFGFKKVAHFSEVGYKFDNWIDVGYWELKL